MTLSLSAYVVYVYINTKTTIRNWQKRGSFYDNTGGTTYNGTTHKYYDGVASPHFYLESCTRNEIAWQNEYGPKIYGASCKGTGSDIWMLGAYPYTGSLYYPYQFYFLRWVYDKGMSGDQTALETITYNTPSAIFYLVDRYGLDNIIHDTLENHSMAAVTNLNGTKVCAIEMEYILSNLWEYRIKITKDFSTFVDVCTLPTYTEVPTSKIILDKTHYYSNAVNANVSASDGGTGGSLGAGTYDVTIIPFYPVGYDTYGKGIGKGSTPYGSVTISANHKINVTWDAVSDATYYYIAFKIHSNSTWLLGGSTANTSYTISTSYGNYDISPIDFSPDYEVVKAFFSADTDRETVWYGLDDSDVTAISYRFNKTDTGNDTLVDNCNYYYVTQIVVSGDTYYIRAKVKHADGNWGSYATTTFTYGDVPGDDSITAVYNGLKVDHLLEDIDNDGTYVYVLVSWIKSDSSKGLKIFKYNLNLVLQSSVDFTLHATKESARLCNGHNDFYVVYVDPLGGGTRRLFYRKASEYFGTEYEINLPNGYDNFIPDGVVFTVNNTDYVLSAVYNTTTTLCKFYVTEIGQTTGTVYDTDVRPCYTTKLEQDPYDTAGMWFNGNVNNDSYAPNEFNYLTISSPVLINRAMSFIQFERNSMRG